MDIIGFVKDGKMLDLGLLKPYSKTLLTWIKKQFLYYFKEFVIDIRKG
jgi:hypothetical protein